MPETTTVVDPTTTTTQQGTADGKGTVVVDSTKPVETKTDESKSVLTADPVKPKVDPSAISITLPKDVKVDEKYLGNFKNVAAELGLTSENAQKLMDLNLGYVDTLMKEFEADVTKQHNDWYAELEKDPEVGGKAWEASVLAAQKAIKKFGGDDFKTALDEMGLGNWPPLVKFFVKLGNELKDDKPSGTERAETTPTNDEEALLRGMYPNTPQMFKR